MYDKLFPGYASFANFSSFLLNLWVRTFYSKLERWRSWWPLHFSAVSTRLKLAVNGVVTDHLGFSFDNQMQSFRYFASLDNALRVFADFDLANHRQYDHEIWAGLVAIIACVGSKKHI